MMAVCVRCNREEAVWQCIICNRAIGKDCAREVSGKIYCLDHVPVQPATETKPKRELSGLVKVIWTVLILLIGTGAILYIMQWYAASMPPIPIASIAAIINLFQTVGLLIVGGLAAIFVILLIAYAVLRRR